MYTFHFWYPVYPSLLPNCPSPHHLRCNIAFPYHFLLSHLCTTPTPHPSAWYKEWWIRKGEWGDDGGEDREDVHLLWWMNTAWGIKKDSALFLNWHSKHWLEINAVKKCSFWQIQLRNALLTNITNNSCGNTLYHQSSAASSLSQLLHLFSFLCQSASLI